MLFSVLKKEVQVISQPVVNLMGTPYQFKVKISVLGQFNFLGFPIQVQTQKAKDTPRLSLNHRGRKNVVCLAVSAVAFSL